MTPATVRRATPPACVAVLASGLLLWFFAPTWFGGQSFAYRDAAHYYYPLFSWTADEWAAGRIPLWNPQENCGVPILADTTSSVLYPGKLLFAAFSFATNYVLYISLHVVLAAVAAYLLARGWRASPLAAGVCGLSYAFGGNVLFQYCNVVFLVSAAWLPLALLAVDRMLVRRSLPAAIALGAVLALMTLGGDPQSAYHVGLAAVLYALLLWRRKRRAARRHNTTLPSRPQRAVWRRFSAHRLVLLSVAASSGFVLAAVQILPAVEWSRRSDRAAFSRPRNIYEAAGYVWRRGAHQPATLSHAVEGLFGEPLPATHHRDIYDFSVSPWRVAEFIWPNISGTSFPVNRRWSALIPAEGRVWTPSLYMGLVPFLLAVASWRVRRGPTRVRWLSWGALLFAVASLGWYGLGWLIEEVRHAWGGTSGQQPLLGMPVGGLYWWMTTLLPGYAYFRYPAKLLVFACLALSVLAARGWDRLFRVSTGAATGGRRKAKRVSRCFAMRRMLLALSAASFLLGLVAAAGRSWIVDQFTAAPTDELFGPIDAAGAWRVVAFAFLQTAVVALVGRALLEGQRRRPAVAWQAAVLLLVAVDLGVANGWMVVAAPRALWRADSRMEDRIAADAAAAVDDLQASDWRTNYRVHRALPDRWVPPAWARRASADRLEEGIAWDHNTMLPKYPLLGRSKMAESFGTLTHNDYQVLMNIARHYGPERPDGITEPHASVLSALSARWLVVPHGFEAPGVELVPPASDADRLADADLLRNSGALPRAWLVHDVELMPPLSSTEPADVGRRTFDVLFPDGRVRDLRREAVVELDVSHGANRLTDALLRGMQAQFGGEPNGAATCRIVVDQPQRVEVECESEEVALLVLGDLDYPGWTAVIGGAGNKFVLPAKILKTNRVMRGVIVPRGKSRVVFTYRPGSFYLGAALSACGWAAVALGLLGSVCFRAFAARSAARAVENG